MANQRFMRLLVATLAIVLLCYGLGCFGNEDTETAQKATQDKFETIRTHIDSWLADVEIESLILPSSYVMDSIVSRWPEVASKYQIVSVRQSQDFDSSGHIANAINIPWVEIINEENLAKLDTGKSQILYCYIGHGSMICTSILSLMGYNCRSLDFGMMDWNIGALVRPPLEGNAENEVELSFAESDEKYPYPVIECEYQDMKEVIREMANRYFCGNGSPVINPPAVKEILDGWDTCAPMYQIVDVRSADDYKAGHVPHAINISWQDIAKPENLSKLDFNKKVITYSENGQVGQMSSTLLNLMGYHAVNMKFGMLDWNIDHVEPSLQWDGGADYPVVK